MKAQDYMKHITAALAATLALTTARAATPMVAGGESHTVAVKENGTVWAWGDNYYGQIGDGSTDNRSTPVQVKGAGGGGGGGGGGVLSGISAVAARGYQTVALKSDGTVWGWGENRYGGLGDGTSGLMAYKSTPVQVKGEGGVGWLSNIAAVAAGQYHTVALKSDGTVWASGDNYYGQLGDGTTTQRTTPVQVKDVGGVLSNIVAVAAGQYHTVALKENGTVWAWGYNNYGQLGDDTTTDRSIPVQVLDVGGVGALSNIVAVAAGEYHTVALKSDGTVWAWGRNDCGQLGDDTTTDRHTPVQVAGLSDVTTVVAGNNHTIALKLDDTIWAWGRNHTGQLGDGTSVEKHTPVQVKGEGGAGMLSGISAVAAGEYHTVALKSDGTVWAWGYNYYGQIGDGTTTQRTTPVQVKGAGGSGWLRLEGELYVTAITVDGARNVILVLNGEAAGATVEMSLDLSDPLGWSEVPATPLSPNTIQIDASTHGNAPVAFFRVKGK